jgi:hypothetical protein
MSQTDQDQADKEYADYLEERKALIAGEQDATKGLDQAMLTLSGTLLGLSITFVQNLAAKPVRAWPLLGLAWLGLLLSLLATLLSFYWSAAAFRKERELRNRLFEGDRSARTERNPFSDRTAHLNKVSIGCFILGVALLGIFTIVNLPYK